ncbi:MAG: WD40 repeat domain-containing protein [Chloroflexia bacterium]
MERIMLSRRPLAVKGRSVLACVTVLLLLLPQALIPPPASAAPIEVARWGEGALTDGGIAYAPDGRTVAVATTIGVRLYNPATRKRLRSLVTPTAVTSMAFAPDGRTLALGLADTNVELWRISDGRLLRRLQGLNGAVWHVTFADGGRLIAAVGDRMLQIWKVADGSPVALPGVDNTDVWEVAFAPDGQTFAVTVGCDLQLRRWPDGALLHALNPAESSCGEHLAFAPDGQTLAETVYGGVVLFRVSDGAEIRTFLRPDEVINRSLVFAPDGRTLAVGADIGERDPPYPYAVVLHLWRVADGVLLHTWDGKWLDRPALAPDGRTLLASSEDDQVHTLSPTSGKELPPLTTLPHPLFHFALAPDGRTLAVSQGLGGVQIRRVADGGVVRTLGATLPLVDDLALSPNGKTLAVRNGVEIRLWRVADGRLLWIRRTAFYRINSFVFTPDSKYLVIAAFQTEDQALPAQVWRATDGRFVRNLGTDPAYALAMAAKGQILAVVSDVGIALDARQTVQFWRIGDWKLLNVLADPVGFNDLEVSADGWWMAGAEPEETGVQIWRVPSGALRRTLVPGDGTLWQSGPVVVAFAPDGLTLAVGGADGLLQIRQVSDGQVVADLPGHYASIEQLAFTPDSRLLVSTAWDGTLRIWRIR